MVGDGETKSLIWTGLEKVFVYGINFLQGVALARLLSPEDFGLTAMLGVFIMFAAIFVDSGFGVALVQNHAFTRADERKVLFFCLFVGSAFYLLLFALAPPIAAFYREPRLIAILRILALTLVLNAPGGIANARLQRTMRFVALSRANILSAIILAAFAVTMALLGFGVWTLVWSNVVGSIVRTAFLCWMARGIGAPNADSSHSEFFALLRYGWKLAASYVLGNVCGNITPLLIGKMQNPVQVGLYTRASTWTSMMSISLCDIVNRVSFPRMASAKDDAAALCRVRNRYAWLGAAMLVPTGVVLWVFAGPIVKLVFGAQWLSSVPYLRILLAAVFFWAFSGVNGVLLGACGRSDYVLKADLIRRPVGLGLLAVGCCFGIFGLCWAKVIADIFDWLVISCFVRKVTGNRLWRDALAL